MLIDYASTAWAADIADLDPTVARLSETGKGQKSCFVCLSRVTREVAWVYLAARYPTQSPDICKRLIPERTALVWLRHIKAHNLHAGIDSGAVVSGAHPRGFRRAFVHE